MLKKLGLWFILISLAGITIMWFSQHQSALSTTKNAQLLLPGQSIHQAMKTTRFKTAKFPKLAGKNVEQDEQTMLLGNEAADQQGTINNAESTTAQTTAYKATIPTTVPTIPR